MTHDAPPPPPAMTLAEYRPLPKYVDVKGFYGNDTFENLKNHASTPVAFAQAHSSIVFTDAVAGNIRLPLNFGDWGMWWPCLAIEINGKWYTWCVAAAQSGWSHGWETHPSRIHMFIRSASSNSSAPQPATPVVIEELNHSTVVIEELY